MTIMGQMDKQNVAYPYNGIFCRNKKDRSADMRHNVDETCKHGAKGKKAHQQRSHIMCSLCIMWPE